MTGAGVDSLAHILQLGLVQSQSLSDLEVFLLILILQQSLRDVCFSFSQEELGGEERVLQNNSSLPALVNLLGEVEDSLGAAQSILI